MLSLDGGTVPWHRVVRADGSCAERFIPSSASGCSARACGSSAIGSTSRGTDGTGGKRAARSATGRGEPGVDRVLVGFEDADLDDLVVSDPVDVGSPDVEGVLAGAEALMHEQRAIAARR